MPAPSMPPPASLKKIAAMSWGTTLSGRPPDSAPCDAVTTIRPASSGCSMPMESAQIRTGSPGTSRMTKRAPSVMAGGATVGTRAARKRSAQLRTLWPGAQPKRCGGAIDVADDAVREHMVAVADMAGLRIGGRSGQVDPVEKIQADNAGVVLADAGIVHDHGTHRPLGGVEGVVAAAIGPGDDDMRAVLGADVRATGDRQDLHRLVCSAHVRSPSVALEHVVQQARRRRPVVGPVGMAGRHEARARIEHLVLLVARGELRADRVPGELVEPDLVAGARRRRLLGLLDQARRSRDWRSRRARRAA